MDSDILSNRTSKTFSPSQRNKKKRPLTLESTQIQAEPRSKQFVTQEEDTTMNTTNHIESSFMVIYFINGVYYVCYHDPITCLLQFLEPIQNTKDDHDVIKIILHQFKPARIMYNNRAKMQLGIDPQLFDYDFKIEVKSSKDFSSAEGECFVDSLKRELNRMEEDSKIAKLKGFLCRLELFDDYTFYVCKLPKRFIMGNIHSILTT